MWKESSEICNFLALDIIDNVPGLTSLILEKIWFTSFVQSIGELTDMHHLDIVGNVSNNIKMTLKRDVSTNRNEYQ